MTALANLRSQNAPSVRNEGVGRGIDHAAGYRPGVDDGFSKLGEDALAALMAGGAGRCLPTEESYGRVSQGLRLDVLRAMSDRRWRTAEDLNVKLSSLGRERPIDLVQSAATSLFSLGLLEVDRLPQKPAMYRIRGDV